MLITLIIEPWLLLGVLNRHNRKVNMKANAQIA
jgi:hypothetical protein